MAMTGFKGGFMAQAMGWTLLDFCWQGIVVAVVVWCLLRLLEGRDARIRYAVALLGLAAMVALPMATFAHRLAEARMVMRVPLLGFDLTVTAGGVAAPVRWTDHAAAMLDGVAPWLPMVWLLGVVGFLIRLHVGWMVARRMQTAGVAGLDDCAGAVPPELLRLLRGLAERMHLPRAVRLAHSAMVQVPTVIGWLRPVVLVPLGCMAGLSVEQIESLLAHELAHIRRHDYLISIVQGVVEALLFYHPAVWWVSRQVRRERECCCDDIAVAVVGDALGYAKALSVLEGRRSLLPELALGANGGVLTMRIKRLLGVRESSAGSQVAAIVVLAALVLAGGISAERLAHAQAAAKQSEPTRSPGTTASASRSYGSATGTEEPEPLAQPGNVDSISAPPQTAQAEGRYGGDNAVAGATQSESEETKRSLATLAQELDSPEFQKQMADARASLAQFNTPKFQKELKESVRSEIKASAQSRKLAATLNDPAFQREMAEARAAIAKVDSPEFRKQMEDAIRSATDSSVQSQKRLGETHTSQALRSQLAQAATEIASIDTPEFRKTVDEAVRRLAEESVNRHTSQRKGLIAQSTAPAPIVNAPAPVVPDSTTAPVRVSGGEMSGQTLFRKNPIYPAEAKAAGVQGAVVLRAVIGKDGMVKDLTVVSGPEALRASALDAVQQWVYKPYLLNGQPTEVDTTVTVNYTLGDVRTASAGTPADGGEIAVGPQRIGGGVSAPMLVYSAQPEYTPEARAAKVSGTVMVSLWVDETGRPGHVRILRGVEDGPGGTKIAGISQEVADGLDEKAVEAVQKYRFKPAMENGKPVPVQLNVEVNFKVF